MMTEKAQTRTDELSEKVLKLMSEGNLHFIFPFLKEGQHNPFSRYNGKIGHTYRGYNQIVLSISAMIKDLKFPMWTTANNIKKNGGNLSGLEGVPTLMPITFQKDLIDEKGKKVIDSKTKKPKKRTVFTGKYKVNYLFSLEEAGIDCAEYDKVLSEKKEMGKDIQEFEDSLGIKIVNSTEAYYSPSENVVGMPRQEKFISLEAYISTKFHEFGHYTGPLLDRDMSGIFGSASYAEEELVAEFTSMLLCDRFDIEYETSQHAAYMKSWAKKVDSSKIFKAFSKAEEAFKYLIDKSEEEKETTQEVA